MKITHTQQGRPLLDDFFSFRPHIPIKHDLPDFTTGILKVVRDGKTFLFALLPKDVEIASEIRQTVHGNLLFRERTRISANHGTHRVAKKPTEVHVWQTESSASIRTRNNFHHQGRSSHLPITTAVMSTRRPKLRFGTCVSHCTLPQAPLEQLSGTPHGKEPNQAIVSRRGVDAFNCFCRR